MPYLRKTCIWDITVKTPHVFRIELREGIVNDTIRLYIDDDQVAIAKAGYTAGMRGMTLFDVDGRTFELKWEWSMWSGHPASIVIMYKGRILARYGNEKAADIDFDED